MSAVIGPIAVGDREQEIFLAARWCSAGRFRTVRHSSSTRK